tara:strand:+ start:4340 stop:4957 length:618 start_codon:yes stop_codon:yes gene_type:complete
MKTSNARPIQTTQPKRNWTISRTLKEKTPSSVINEFGRNVRFGGFTKENEKFVSRLAMLGMAGTFVGEYLTGNGALAQFDVETGLQLWETKDILVLQAAAMLGAASIGLSTGGKAITDPDALVPYKSGSIIEQLGLNEERPFGFTEENELFVGRLAQMGFAGSTLIEAYTGKGPLAQINATSGEIDVILFAVVLFGLFGALVEDK